MPTTSDEADTYLDEHGRAVFTAAYHLRRGYCCGNGCRHCPWRDDTDRDDRAATRSPLTPSPRTR